MALHRKCEALLSLRPDVAVISECAEPDRLRRLSKSDWLEADPVWIGRSETKGLAVLGFNGYRVDLATAKTPDLRHIAPVRVSGPFDFNLLAVWAQNASAGVTRKHQHGPLRRALRRYRAFLADGPTVIAGDFNSNAIWDKPGWRNNHSALVGTLHAMGLISAYHAVTGEAQGRESTPTLYWRDRTRDGPTYHIDYIFIPEAWQPSILELRVGAFDDWCGNGLSDHVPVVVDVGV
jgi:exodeoxyribonuclease-3